MVRPLRIKIFADGADPQDMIRMAKNNPLVKGFTTNPSLMKKAGVKDYYEFIDTVVREINLPISFEVFADDYKGMLDQAIRLAAKGPNVVVKIPITNTIGIPSTKVIRDLSAEGVVINVTAVFTLAQVQAILEVLHPDTPAIVSVFAGRIADTGIDPMPHMHSAKRMINGSKVELLWASTREIYNVFQAEECGCDIVTVPNDLLNKMDQFLGKDLLQFSRETVQMFYRDAQEAGYALE